MNFEANSCPYCKVRKCDGNLQFDICLSCYDKENELKVTIEFYKLDNERKEDKDEF